jgi:Protein of unknown function (DUF3237)
MWVHDDGFWRPDVRAPFTTDDGETILMHYTGLVQQTSAFKQAAEANNQTNWDDQYMRLMIHFDTGAERFAGSTHPYLSPRGGCLAPATLNMPWRA